MMTTEELRKLSPEAIAEYIMSCAKEFNDSDKGSNAQELSDALDTLSDASAEYNAASLLAHYKKLRAEEKPMLALVKEPWFSAIKVRAKHDKDTNTKVIEVVEYDKEIDPGKFDAYCKSHTKNVSVAVNPAWEAMIEKFDYLLAYDAISDLCSETKDEKLARLMSLYPMQKISRQIDLGETPTSNTSLLRTLTTIIQAMIGPEYKPTSHEVAYLKMVYASAGKEKLSVKLADHAHMRMFILDMCHRIVCKKEYRVLHKERKDK